MAVKSLLRYVLNATKIGNIENINFGDVYFRYGEKQVLNGVTFFLNEPGLYIISKHQEKY